MIMSILKIKMAHPAKISQENNSDCIVFLQPEITL